MADTTAASDLASSSLRSLEAASSASVSVQLLYSAQSPLASLSTDQPLPPPAVKFTATPRRPPLRSPPRPAPLADDRHLPVVLAAHALSLAG